MLFQLHKQSPRTNCQMLEERRVPARAEGVRPGLYSIEIFIPMEVRALSRGDGSIVRNGKLRNPM